MLDSTAAYKTAIKASQRYTDAIVVVSFAKEIPIPDTFPAQYESPFGTPSTSSELDGFPASQLSNGRIRVNPIQYNGATQNDGIDIPILQQLPAEVKVPSTGWKSEEESDAEGLIDGAVTITVEYTGRTAQAIWIVGTATNYPVDFYVRINGVSTLVEGNTKEIYVHNFTEVVVTSVEVEIGRISQPLTNAHVVELGVPTRVYFDRHDIIDMGGVEEVHADVGSYIGNVSANECSVRFNNTSGIFDISSDFSPLTGMIRAEIEFKPFLGVEISEDVVEMVAMGSFTSSDWPVSVGTGEFTLQGLDYMETLRKMPMPYVSTANDPLYLSLSNYASYTAQNANINISYTVYHEVSLILAYSPRKTVKEFLQDVATALPGVAYVSRLNFTTVREFPLDDNVTRNPVKSVWSDTNIILGTVNPQKFSNVYSKLTIAVPHISPVHGVEVFYAKSITLTTGKVLTNIAFTDSIYYIETIEVRGGTNVTVSDVKYNATSGQLTLSCTGTQTVELIIKACVINVQTDESTFLNPTVNGRYDLNKDIDTPYLQSVAACTTYATEYFLALGDPTSNFEVETYWDPSVELCDRITLTSPAEGLSVDIAVMKQTWTWDGTLSAMVEGRKLFHRGG
jgi:hypothetical protein